MTEAKNYNPFKVKSQNATSDSGFKEKVNVKKFFRGAGKVGKKVLSGARKGATVTHKAVSRGTSSAIKTTSQARTKLYNARALHLERKQNIATYKANIASQQQIRSQQKTVSLESKIKQRELKQQQRELRKVSQAARKPYRGLSDAGLKKKSGALNNPRKRGGFFDWATYYMITTQHSTQQKKHKREYARKDTIQS